MKVKVCVTGSMSACVCVTARLCSQRVTERVLAVRFTRSLPPLPPKLISLNPPRLLVFLLLFPPPSFACLRYEVPPFSSRSWDRLSRDGVSLRLPPPQNWWLEETNWARLSALLSERWKGREDAVAGSESVRNSRHRCHIATSNTKIHSVINLHLYFRLNMTKTQVRQNIKKVVYTQTLVFEGTHTAKAKINPNQEAVRRLSAVSCMLRCKERELTLWLILFLHYISSVSPS